ncbi:MAG TPA: F-box protein [Rhabdochlamydiaceae bacterium]|nr:F-box protein [Rhabdochlamydiaceae bacterium]
MIINNINKHIIFEMPDILRPLLPSIFSYLDSKSFFRCFRVCKEWRSIANLSVENLKLKCEKLRKEMVSSQNKSISWKEKLHALCALTNWKVQSVFSGEIKKYTFRELREEVEKADKECLMKDQAFIKADNELKKLLERPTKN